MKNTSKVITTQTLDDLVELADSGTWGDDGTPGTDSPVLRSTNIAENRLSLSEPAWRVIPASDQVRRKLATGDIIVTKSSGSPDHIGKCAIFDDPTDGKDYYFSNFMLRLRAKKGHADPRWLHYWLTSDSGRFILQQMNSTTTGLRNLSVGQYLQQRIPTPPLPEQRRIADILDKADAIRRKRQEAQSELIRLIDSQFLNVFGDPLANPKKWVAGKFDDHLTLVQYGPRFFNEAYSSDGIRIVRITDLDRQGRLEYDAMPRMTVSEKDRESFLLRNGDLLLARSGATVGKTALIDEAAPECIAGAYFIRLRFTHKIRPLFAQMVLRSKPVQTIIAEKSKQSAQQNFNGPAIRALPLPAPPTKLQDEFVAFYKNAIESGKRLLKASNEVNDLFNSLVQRAFRGEL